MKMPARLVASEALKVVSRNSRRSIIGSARVSWRRAKDTPTTSPPRTAETASGPIPSWAISFSPNTTASTATRDMAALTRSRRAGAGGGDPRAEDEQGGHHRQRHEEDRAPPEAFQQRPAQHRADRATDREAGDPDP